MLGACRSPRKPKGSDKGGTIVAEGTPEAVAKTKGSYTGGYLKGMLGKVAEAAE